jgi:hypothetical protein
MKNIIKVSLFSVLFLGLLSMFSCTKDFEDMNKNPNVPGIDKAAPDMLLTNAIESMTDRVHEIFLGHEMGSCWVQHMAKCQYTDEDRYIYRPSVVNNSWTSFYAASGEDVATIYSIGNSNYKGVALVLRCYISSVLTDLFGPIPYTQAWQGSTGNILPAYDDQQFIYTDMIAKLDEANTLLDPDGSEIAGDILFNNDIMKWKKFANSLRLRLLLRMSGRSADVATAEMTKMINDPTTYPIFESNDDNAALQYLGSAPNNNPINENRKTRDDHRVSKNFIDLLNNTYYDYRVMVFAMPDALGTFDGMPNGLTSALAAAYNGGGLANTSKIGSYFAQANAVGQLMSFAELQFLLAEAAAKNFIPGGMEQAKTYYIAGITASFEQYRSVLQGIFTDHSGGSYGGLSIPADYTVDDEIAYHTTDATAPAYWNEANALQLIAEQKYIAMFDQGLQSWFEWRRTGFPVLTPAEYGANGGKIPVRVPYPSDESATNPGNLADGIKKLGGADDLNTRVWWDID